MKRIFLFLSFVCLLAACHKREYPVFNYPQAESYSHTKPAAASQPAALTIQATASTRETLLATAEADLAAVVAAPTPLPAAATAASQPQSIRKTPANLTLTEKLVSRKTQKNIRKIQSPEKGKKANATIDTISLLSLVAGLGGLALLLLTGSGLGLLLGVLGLILGIVGLSRIRKGKAPGSSRTLAILGIVFGGLVVLLGLLVIAVFASFGLL